MYAAGTTGNGSAPVTLLSSSLTPDSTGAITVPGTYTCPSSGSIVYLVARGGHVGSGATNSGIVLASVLGPCSTISTSSSFTINEATTVAFAYAMAQFLSPGGNLGGASTNTSGIKLAAAAAANLVNMSTGAQPGTTFPQTTGTAPTATINSLANLLNACIVSSGSSSTACTQLYSSASVSGNTPSNTLDAVLNIAKHPGNNVAALYTQSAASTAYTPVLAAAPSDWTMFVTYAGGGMNDPSALSIDSAGNVWVANYFSVASLFSNTGTPMVANGITGDNLYSSYGIAVDANDTAWITNEQSSGGINGGLGSMTLLSNASGSVTANTYGAGGLNFPISVAIDTGATSWIVDYGNSHLTLMDKTGSPLSGVSGYTTNQFIFPVAVAVDSKRNGYVANQSSNTITKVARDGSSFTSYVTGSGPSGVAVDGSDNVWVANYYGDTVNLVSSTGNVSSTGGFTGGGINHPQGIAIDGSGTAWVANYRGPSITQLAGASTAIPGAALSPAAGWGPDAKLLEAFSIAIDAAGNIWVSNFGSNTLTEFVGMAAPVKTPLLGPVSAP